VVAVDASSFEFVSCGQDPVLSHSTVALASRVWPPGAVAIAWIVTVTV
jgi:hypothetical protein